LLFNSIFEGGRTERHWLLAASLLHEHSTTSAWSDEINMKYVLELTRNEAGCHACLQQQHFQGLHCHDLRRQDGQ
jgi:hypothetical protein